MSFYSQELLFSVLLQLTMVDMIAILPVTIVDNDCHPLRIVMASETIGQKLRRLRQQRGWSQGVVASKIDVVQQAYSHYETGRVEPSVSMLLKLAEVFAVNPEVLFPTDTSPPIEVSSHAD